MRPNIFIDSTHCDEDYFSHALAYVLNTVPGVGDRFVDRIGGLAGKRAGYFRPFVTCEFVGHEFPEGHRSSKPDLRLVCGSRTIFFENKLETAISDAQMERHGELVETDPKSHLMFVSNIPHRRPRLRTMKRYLHPRGQDHYLWNQLLQPLEQGYRKGTIAARILSDFSAGLKVRGMIGRTIKGAGGSLYTRGSEASHVALTQLAVTLRDLGFTVVRKQSREGTLRVYPLRYGVYPLLNPRFYATGAWMDLRLDFDCLVFNVISKGRDRHLSAQIEAFGSRRDCRFVPDPFVSADGYTYHGHFVLPVTFSESRDGGLIDFEAFLPALSRLRRALTR